MAGGFGEEGFYVGRTAPDGTVRKSSAPGIAVAGVCLWELRWSLVCDTAALLARCMGGRECNQ